MAVEDGSLQRLVGLKMQRDDLDREPVERQRYLAEGEPVITRKKLAGWPRSFATSCTTEPPTCGRLTSGCC